MLSKFSVQGDTAPRFLYSVHIKLKVWAVGSYSSGPPAGGTFVLMSTEYRNQGAVSPCTNTQLVFQSQQKVVFYQMDHPVLMLCNEMIPKGSQTDLRCS